MLDLLTKDLSLFKKCRSKCRSMKLHLTRDILMQSQPLVWMKFPACAKFNGKCVGYSVREYPRFDSCINPWTNFTRNTTDHPGHKRLALMSNIQRENARFHNGCFNSSNKTLGRVGEDVGYLLPKSLIPCERYIAELPGFRRENAMSYVRTVLPGRTLNRYLYPMDERHCRGTLRSAQLPRIRLGFSYQF